MSHLAETNGFGFLYAKNEVYNAPGLLNFDCLKAAIEKFEKHCGKLSDYALKHVRTLAHMCSYQNDAYYFLNFMNKKNVYFDCFLEIMTK